MRNVILVGMILAIESAALAEIRTDFLLDSDPDLEAPAPVDEYPVEHRPLWLTALARPEVEYQRRAAEAIAEAHAHGTPGLGDAAPALIKIVSADDSHNTARLAAARALTVLNARESAESLFAASQKFGAELKQTVEPTLAKWQFEPIRDVWRKRLADAETRHRELMLAIDGLRAVGDRSAIPALLRIVQEPLRPTGTRLAAARAAGQIQEAGLEPEAENLLTPKSVGIINRLCAIALLERHRGTATQELVRDLAGNEEPTIAAAALTLLNSIDPQLALPLSEQALTHRDANVRRQGIATLLTLINPDHVTRLSRLLDDPHPGIRIHVCEQSLKLAEAAELRSPVIAASVEVLNAEGWRGQEQAALLLGSLKHRDAANRLLQLLDSPRGEVQLAAAWGLRKLAVPETLPVLLEKVRQAADARDGGAGSSAVSDGLVAHLCETIGLMKYTPADPVLRRFVPKNLAMGDFSRSSAIWALGHLHAGVPDEPLAELMIGRLTEPPAIPSETERVRMACAVSLGRMQAKSQVAAMRKYLGPTVGLDEKSLAIRWAIHELTGELLPPPEPRRLFVKSAWFLERLK